MRLWTCLAAVAALTLGLPQARAQQVYYGESRGWTTFADFANGSFNGCAALINRDGGTWGMAQGAGGDWRLVFGAPGNYGQRGVTIDIDRATFPYNVADGDGENVIVRIDYSSLEAVRRGNWMTIAIDGGATGTFSLAGTAAAILKIEECVAYQGNTPTPGGGNAGVTSGSGGGAAVTPPSSGGKPATGGVADVQTGGAPCPAPATAPSIDAGGPATLYFVNDTGRALTIYWIDRSGRIDSIAALPAEDGVVIDTTIGHSFLVRDIDGACYGGVIRSGGPSERIDIR